MHLGYFGEALRSMGGGDLASHSLDLSGGSLGQFQAQMVLRIAKPVDKGLACQDRGGRHRHVALGLGALLQFDLLPALHQGPLKLTGIGELVAQGPRAVGPFLQKRFDDPGMSPCQQAIEVSKSTVKIIVALGTDADDFVGDAVDLPDGVSQGSDAGVGGDLLAVSDSGIHQVPGDRGVGVDPGNHERTEEIAFATFIDPEMRREHLGLVNLFVAELGLTENLRFEREFHKVFGFPALDQHLRSFLVSGDVQLVLFARVECVGFLRKRKTLILEDAAELIGLLFGQGGGVAGKGFRHRGVRGKGSRKCVWHPSADRDEKSKENPVAATTVHRESRMIEKPISTRDPLAEAPDFQRSLIDWFAEMGRDYPWRQTTDPYAILVSEIMLQQTRIATVLERGYFDRWMKRFPDVSSLAEAPEAEVLKHWEGLGYYNRARNLQRAAAAVVERHEGRFPGSGEEILALPGVGRYTAGAVISFAYDRPAPLVDGNVVRVFARLFDFREAIESSSSQKQLWEWAENLLPDTSVREYNSALMELGQRVCGKGAPDCASCPVSAFCASPDPEGLPRKKAARETVFVTEHALFAIRNNGAEILLEQESGSRRKGLWRLPLVSERRGKSLPVLLKSKYAITHHRVDLRVLGPVEEAQVADLTGSDPEGERFQWCKIEGGLEEIAMPSPFRKAVGRVLQARAEASSFRLES